MTTEIHGRWAQQVLTETSDDVKFEKFAADLCAEAYNRIFVCTSQNYDDGADARTLGFDNAYLLCATLRDDASKPISDAKKIVAKRASPSGILFVYAKQMTEHNMGHIEKDLRERVKLNCKIESISSTQIVDMLEKGIGVAVFLKHYLAEYDTLRQRTIGHLNTSPASLSLAFTALTVDEAAELRTTLMQRALLFSLAAHPNKSVPELKTILKSEFGLAHASDAAIEYHVARSRKEGTIETSGAAFKLSDKGEALCKTLKDKQVASYVNGKELVLKTLQLELGQEIPDREWEKLWSKIESLLINLFQREGMKITKLLIDINERGEMGELKGNPASVIYELVSEAAKVWSGPSQQDVRYALINVFSPKNKDVYEWLLRLGSAYVVFCTLGLDQTVSQALRKVLSDTTFYFDTDIVLSYLCSHEDGNKSATAIKDFSAACGHKTVVPFSVVEECVRHANRAIIDSERAGISPAEKLNSRQIMELFATVFGREFEFLKSEGAINANGWADYMAQFTNLDKVDRRSGPDTEIFEALLDECGFTVLGKLKDEDRSLVVQVEAIFEEKVKAMRHPILSDPDKDGKLKTDAELILAIQKNMTMTGSTSYTKNILITSASVLKISRDALKKVIPNVPQIMGLSEVMWLFSMLPGSNVSVHDLGMYLYEGNFTSTWQGLEKLIYQVVSKTETIKIPPAQKERLIHQLKIGMISQARRHGNPRQVLADAYFNPSLMASLVSAAIDAEAEIVQNPKAKTELKTRLDALAEQLKEQNRKNAGRD